MAVISTSVGTPTISFSLNVSVRKKGGIGSILRRNTVFDVCEASDGLIQIINVAVMVIVWWVSVMCQDWLN